MTIVNCNSIIKESTNKKYLRLQKQTLHLKRDNSITLSLLDDVKITYFVLYFRNKGKQLFDMV